jgi:hypothetical protein
VPSAIVFKSFKTFYRSALPNSFKAHKGDVQNVQIVRSARQAGFVQIEKDNETVYELNA